MNEKPIGVFDSGLGGLTVLAELIHLLPHENYIYVGDTARVPYGSRSKETVIKYSLEIASYLVKQNIKLLVVACNTSSSYSLDILKEKFDVPVIGVVEPGVYAFFEQSSHVSVAVLGTRATINSNIYAQTIKKIDPEIQVFSKACPLFVPLVEEGWIDNEVARATIKEYLNEIVEQDIQDIILGCTHYPLLKKAILAVYPHLNLIDSSKEIAKYVQRILKEKNMQNPSFKYSTTKIYLTDITEKVSFLEKLFLEKDGFLVVSENEAHLKDKPNIKFRININELPLEQLVKV